MYPSHEFCQSEGNYAIISAAHQAHIQVDLFPKNKNSADVLTDYGIHLKTISI